MISSLLQYQRISDSSECFLPPKKYTVKCLPGLAFVLQRKSVHQLLNNMTEVEQSRKIDSEFKYTILQHLHNTIEMVKNVIFTSLCILATFIIENSTCNSYLLEIGKLTPNTQRGKHL